MIRLNTTLAGATSAEWSPVGETILQGEIETTLQSPTVTAEAKVNAAAPWAGIAAIKPKGEKFLRIAKVPFLRVTVKGNEAGKFVKVYDNE